MNLKISILIIFSITVVLSCKVKPKSSINSIPTNIKVLERFQLADGVSLGAAGAYEVIRLRIESFLDAKSATYSHLEDAKLWAKNGKQYAPYATTMIIFRPIDSTKANGTVLFEWPNRGRTFALRLFNDAQAPRPQRSDEPSAIMAEIPKKPSELGNKFLFNHGYTLVWAGWETNTYHRSGIFAELPIYNTEKPTPICEEFAVGFRANSNATSLPLLFESIATNDHKVSLTKRTRTDSTLVNPKNYTITDKNEIALLSADGQAKTFDRGAVYQLQYAAQKYPLSGFGLAIMNEIALGIKKQGALSELARWGAQKSTRTNILSMGASQPGRALRTFLRKVPDAKGFNGHYIIAAGAGQSLIDGPFSQTSKTATAFYDSFLPEFLEEKPLVLKSSGPKVMELLTSSEYWQKAAFLTHAEKDGTARDLSTNHRIYFLTGIQHSGGNGIRSNAGPCLFQRNFTKPTPIMRALFTALDNWTQQETPPPPTSVPELTNASLVTAEAINFGAILGTKNPTPHAPPFFNKANQSKKMSNIFLPNINQVGNEIGGIRLPAISVPLSTRTGWNIDKNTPLEDCFCHQYGSYFPLATNEKARNTTDSRPTIAALYADESVYTNEIEKEINQLIMDGYLLKEEKESLVKAALKAYERALATHTQK